MGNKNAKNEFDIALETLGEKGLCEKILQSVTIPEELEKLKKEEFDIECLVFEGGGVKGCAYGGAILLMHELGILKKIKRVAGASAGAFMALLVVLDTPLAEMVAYILPSMKQYEDEGAWKFVYNILKTYGWHSGINLKTQLEKIIEQRLGKKNVTFRELYDMTGKELCVVITNLNMRCVKYCHPKTTPSLDIAQAIRTSMSIPMIYQPQKKTEHGLDMYYVDGGLLDNYPLHVFDGWFLSMKPEDSLLEKMGEDPAGRFAEVNQKALGMVLFSYGETQPYSPVYLKRLGDKILDRRPESPLAIERNYTKDIVQDERLGQESVNNAARSIINFMADEVKAKGQGTDMTVEEFRNVIEKAKKDPHVAENLVTLFGDKDGLSPVEESFSVADTSKDNKLSLVECLEYLHARGVYLRYDMASRYPAKIPDITSFLFSMLQVMLSYIKELKAKPSDQERTIGIYTDYVTTTDFDIDNEDKVYILRQGYRAAAAFLKEKAGMKD